MGADYSESTTETINVTEEKIINSLYNIVENTVYMEVQDKIDFKTGQSNSNTIFADGSESVITNLTIDQKNELDVKTKLYLNLQQYITEQSTNTQTLNDIISNLQDLVTQSIKDDESLLNLMDVQTNTNISNQQQYLNAVQETVNNYVSDVSNKIAHDQNLKIDQTNAQDVYAINGGKITNAVIDQFNEQETQFESEICSEYSQYTNSVNDQYEENTNQTETDQTTENTSKSAGTEYFVIMIVIVCVIVAIIIIAVVVSCVKNPEGVKAVGQTVKDVGSVAAKATPEGAALSAASSLIGGAIAGMTKQGALAIIIVLSILIIVGIILIIDGAISYITNDCLLTQTARNLKLISNNQVYQQDPSNYKNYTEYDLHKIFEEEFNTGNIIEISIGSVIVVGCVIPVCILGDKWNKQGLLK